ncbi:MAG: response regulator transcription factor [Halieaceae bacterium]|jgi:two-component system, NarL family, nitrate/nitrite response regulator NarL|nr:response regulator transcription factor [Halieaceae bacterium]
MVKQFFVTPGGNIRNRWQEAFPEASVVTRLMQLPEASKASPGVLWLDFSAIAQLDRVSMLEESVGLGWPVIVLAATPSESEAFQLLNIGARGYCHVNAHPQQLCEVGTAVEHGGLWMPPNLMQRLLALSLRVVPQDSAVGPDLSALTSRELMVAREVAKGGNNREVASALGITERTVKAHLSTIFEKLEVRDRVQLALCTNNVSTR